MYTSALGQLVLWLHRRAHQSGTARDLDAEAQQLLDALHGDVPEGPLTEHQLAGLELRSGRPRSELAKKVQRAALARLRAPDLVLLAVDELGYSPVLVRALLQHHYQGLRQAALGSEQHSVYIDLRWCIAQATEKTKQVALLLVAGYGPQEIGVALTTNGSRRIGRAMVELSRLLEGRAKGGS